MNKVLFFFATVLILGFCSILIILAGDTGPGVDIVAINDAAITAMQSDDPDKTMSILTNSLQHEYERMDLIRRQRDVFLLIFLIIYSAIITATTFGIYIYCRRRILLPFDKLQIFARNVAAGNLEIPLESDKGGVFGAFTESFDLMREELKKAGENERNAERSKKELVASLSHDIKTPVASIKATTELLLLSAENEKERNQLEQIEIKAEQINTLITDMFHATLEELQALSVSVTEIHSTEIPGLIRNADYKGLIRKSVIPDCIILADIVRLQQIFDNLIGNSYKYADTTIDTEASFDGQYLIIKLSDSGPGVPQDELPLLTGKYYRGKNATEKSGYGLGLYISKHLLTQMSGDLYCENQINGFTINIILKLA